jgi:hypothetical protein
MLRNAFLFAVVSFVELATGRTARAQNNNGFGGILIDADGVVTPAPPSDLSPALLRRQREAFINDNLPVELQEFSEHRVISLAAVERAFLEAVEVGEPIPEAVMYLGGLQRIDYVFVSPERHDIALAGPAEVFAPDEYGRMVGVTTGRPCLRLDDLVVALQVMHQRNTMLGCSIDHDEERLAELQRFNQQNSGAATPEVVAQRYQQMAGILGMQHVTVWGAPGDSHFARVLVEADYRMKRISLGVETSGVREIPSYLSMLELNGNNMQRWWFMPLYDAVHVSEDGLAFQFVGQRLQLMAQDEVADAQGNRSNAAFTRASTQRFAQVFTEHYEDLAERNPVFADLQNLFDLGITAALIRQHNLAQEAGWEMSGLMNPPEGVFETFNVPQSVPSEAMSRRAGRYLLGVIGGITLDPYPVIDNLSHDEVAASRIGALQVDAFTPGDGSQTFWWDRKSEDGVPGRP